MASTTKFQSMPLSRLGRTEDYDIYRAGLEWDLTDPIVIESQDDFRSTPRWRDRFQPYHHQVTNLITFCRRLPVTLLADDVGLGKTISAGLVISELAARAKVNKVLIVCPKLLCPQWKQELEEKFDIPGIVAIGVSILEALKADPEKLGAVITTYNSSRLYLEQIPEGRFQMLILDEAHKLRNLFGVANPPQVAKRFHKALQDSRFKYVLMLTATPIQNRLWDLYSLVDLLAVARGHGNPFGSEEKRSIASGLHRVSDAEVDLAINSERLAKTWAEAFEARITSVSLERVRRSFTGKALLRVRANVAHDSYERLVTVDCAGEDAIEVPVPDGLAPIGKTIRNPAAVGLDPNRLIVAAENDDAIAEFCRFYEERRELEVEAAAGDVRKAKKLEDDFTPRLDISLVGLEGMVQRDVVMRVNYGFATGGAYDSEITVRPRTQQILESPPTELCSKSGLVVPKPCLDRCAATRAAVLRHLLAVSDVSRRKALPESMVICSFSGKRAIQDEMGVFGTARCAT